MTAKNHLFFSIIFTIIVKNAMLFPTFVQGDWWHIIPSAMLTCLLPDIDHPKSFLGQRLKWISKPISQTFGHRGFTHSLLAIFIMFAVIHFKIPECWIVPEDSIQGMELGYMSHILADMFTPAGVPLLWPCHWRFCLPLLVKQRGSNQLELAFCIVLFIYVIWMPQNLFKNDVVQWLSKIINSLQF